MSRRPTRASTKKVPNPALEKLRKIKDGEATHLDLLETKDDELYEEVDTREYLLRRQRENKFIEDDDGSGYVDHGQVEYNYSDEEEELPNLKKAGDKRKKPIKESKELEVRPGEQLLNYFQPGSKLGHTKKAKPMDTDALMGDIFKKLESEIEQFSGKKPALPFASALPRKSAPLPSVAPTVPESPLTRLNAALGTTSIPLKREPAEEIIIEPKAFSPVLPSAKAELISQADFDDLDDVCMDIDIPTISAESVPEEPKWKALQAEMFTTPIETKVESVQVPAEMNQDENVRYLYWIDAYAQENNGHVYVMGKMLDPEKRKLVSCCVVVTNIQRNVYLLPDPPIAGPPETEDEEEEERINEERTARVMAISDEILPKWSKVYANLDFELSLVSRSYSFDTPANIPKEAHYVKMTYPAVGKECAFATGLKGHTFRHVFGSNTTALELFLVKRKIMGPGWLRIEGAVPSASSRSHCKLEFEVDNPKRITPVTQKEMASLKLVPPPLDVMSINIKTVLNPKTNANELAVINLIVFPNVDLDDDTPAIKRPAVRIAAIRQLPNTFVSDQVKETLVKQGFECEIVQTEQALLNYMLSRFAFYDPDVLVGHSFLEFTLAVLLARMDALQVATWARLGRLRRTKIPKSCLGSGQMAAFQQRNLINGRLLCDTYHGAKDTVKSKNYSLGQLCSSHLSHEREDIPIDAVASYYSQEDALVHLVLHGSFDAYLQAALMFKLQLLPLSRQLTMLAGNLWNHTMMGARAKRNEFLLLHEFHKKKFICPDRQQHKGEESTGAQDQPARRKAAYLGGLVLEPKRGLYESLILLLDFNSLYPSIIQEYNICFTTVERDPSNEDTLPDVPSKDTSTGLLPEILKKLIQQRSEVKKLLKDKDITPSKAVELDIKQKALKLTANSMYGCLGYPLSRFYAKQLAMLITSKGREALQSTVELATSEGLEIIYGDTDSIMINTHTQEVAVANQLARNFKAKVNQSYSKLEIDIDGIFRRLLLLQKKKYAALLLQERRLPNGTVDYTTTVEAKGLDIVRREFCDLSHTMSEVVLKHILSGADKDTTVQLIYDYLTSICQQIRSGAIPPERFIIYKSISKDLVKYADAASQPHVQVALRLQKQQGFAVGKGSTIDYIICLTDDPSKPYAQRAFSADEASKDSSLQVDYDWYISRQLLPPITRLCEPIDGITMSQLAESLGLDGSKFIAYQNSAHSETIFDNLVSQEQRFQDIAKLPITCVRCPGTVVIEHFAAVVDDVSFLTPLDPHLETATCFGLSRLPNTPDAPVPTQQDPT
ncbi:DNA-directed DNA polymerase alpha catalytic subunit pol1, variant 2 [Entomophthora muscae]|uniref:DNA-directed DNA polymerase alpha catalytic subunit pol1, variant 2 n=1 Tax=Entomophthora muscae TaxID=34485 RepID=A0ACC2TQM9_9FUNG|nr:DNA-directed DNA polymerase alpha catalytic subunit pol1, variant 2 [Entomophthora muscae]